MRLLIVLSLVLLRSAATAGAGQDKPAGRTYPISGGRLISEPRFSEGKALTILGKGDYRAVADRVRRLGLRPVPADLRFGKAFVAMQFISYDRGSLGPYDEFLLHYPVLNQNGLTTREPLFGYYMERLILDGKDPKAVDLAMEVGIDIYGYPKHRGGLRYDFAGPDKRFSVRQAGDASGLEVTIDAKGAEEARPASRRVKVVTSGLGHRRWAVVESREQSTRFRRLGAGDTVELPPLGTQLGDLVKGIGFVASRWRYAPSFHFDLSSKP